MTVTNHIERLRGRDLAFHLRSALSPEMCLERLDGGLEPVVPVSVRQRVQITVKGYEVNHNTRTVMFDLLSKVDPSFDVYTMRVNVQIEDDPPGSQVIVTPQYRSIHWQIIPGIIFVVVLISMVLTVFIGPVPLFTAVCAVVGLVWIVAQTRQRSDLMLTVMRESLEKALE